MRFDEGMHDLEAKVLLNGEVDNAALQPEKLASDKEKGVRVLPVERLPAQERKDVQNDVERHVQ